jgi:ribosomal protein L35
MKTNKSYLKRLKVTKTGKILARSTGQNHFNSKESSATRLAKGRKNEFHMSNKERSRFLVNL